LSLSFPLFEEADQGIRTLSLFFLLEVQTVIYFLSLVWDRLSRRTSMKKRERNRLLIATFNKRKGSCGDHIISFFNFRPTTVIKSKGKMVGLKEGNGRGNHL